MDVRWILRPVSSMKLLSQVSTIQPCSLDESIGLLRKLRAYRDGDIKHYMESHDMAGTNNQLQHQLLGRLLHLDILGHGIVFSADYHSSNQHIWNLGEGQALMTITSMLALQDRRLYFGWGRQGDLNELYLGTLNPNIDWYGLYIGFNGARFGDNCTASDLASLRRSADPLGNNFQSTYNWSNDGASTGWNSSFGSTGGRMNRQYQGKLTLGGRGANRSFHGKIANFVTTTLRLNDSMPSDAEIEAMITDPVAWVDDYKVGNATESQMELRISVTSSVLPHMETAHIPLVHRCGSWVMDLWIATLT